MEVNETTDESQATFFEGLPSSYDIDAWKNYLEQFGHVRTVLLTSDNTSGYALFEKHSEAINAVESLNASFWPEGSETQIYFHVVDNQEMKSLLDLEIPESLNGNILFNPEAASSLFHVTKTEPPIFWSFAKEEQ